MKKFLAISPMLVLVSCVWSRAGVDPPAPLLVAGRGLFLKNCAHCHGADGHGDDGPDLHNLDWTDAQIARRIRDGKKGQMTTFSGKLSADEIDSLVAYVRTLK